MNACLGYVVLLPLIELLLVLPPALGLLLVPPLLVQLVHPEPAERHALNDGERVSISTELLSYFDNFN